MAGSTESMVSQRPVELARIAGQLENWRLSAQGQQVPKFIQIRDWMKS
jgi:hypothetical protein